MQYKEEGNRFFQEGSWAKAIERYSQGLEQDASALPPDTRGLLLSNRSQCWINLGQWEKALNDADSCLKLLPEHVKSLYRRAHSFEQLGKKAEAVADYVKVVRAEPQNRSAVEAAKRLRDELMRSGEQRRDEALPSHLLDVLRGESGEAEAAADACRKLRALCVHRKSTGSLLSAGALDLLVQKAVASETPAEVRDEALACLSAMASGYEKEEDDEPAPRNEAPPPAVEEVRKRLRCALPLAELRPLCRHRASSARHLALTVGFTHELEDLAALEAIHDALAFVEEGHVNVPRAGVTALASMCEARRRLGKRGRPVMPTSTLLKCLESALGTSHSLQLQGLLASVFALLADDDRPKGAEVDLASVGLRVLEPFLQAEEAGLRANGLAGLAALLAASVQAATQLLQQSPVPLVALLTALKRPAPGAEGRCAQDQAAECLLLAVGERKTRQQLLDADGIDVLLSALADGEEGSGGLVRAKFVGVLAVVAGHNKEVREEVFDRLDFLLELRDALGKAREAVRAAAAPPALEQAKRLCRGLYESCACLTIHGQFKELLMSSKRTLQAVQELARPEELAEDAQLAFFYASITHNLCRSREDKMRPKRNEFPFNELEEGDLDAIEEFYEKMPAESRPVKNGEIDAGSRELAEQFRIWAAQQSGSGVVQRLGRCAVGGSPRVKGLVALTFKLLCAEKEHRRFIISAGGIRTLLELVDLSEELPQDAARQALAQLLIVTNPALLQYNEQLGAVRPLVQLLEHRHELLQFEAAMALTNLLTVGEELRSRALQADAWRACRDLLFSENELLQRAGLEAMCNLTMAPEVLERFASGRAALEIKVFIGFSHSEDLASCIAASGALAMLASCEEVALQIAGSENFGDLLEALAKVEDAGVQHRLVAALAGICESQSCPAVVSTGIREALRALRGKGLASCEADALVRSLLDESTLSAGGA